MTQGFESFLSTTQYIYTIIFVRNQEFSVKFQDKDIRKIFSCLYPDYYLLLFPKSKK